MFDWCEGFFVVYVWVVFVDRRYVRFGVVFFVVFEVVYRKFFVDFEYYLILCDFGDDRCGGDGDVFCVIFYDCFGFVF